MKTLRAWDNPKIFSRWFLAGIVILFVGLFIYPLLTPPLYQSQIVVKFEPCRADPYHFIYCSYPAKVLVRIADSREIRQAVQQQLSLPSNMVYKVSSTRESAEIATITVEVEKSQLAQAIANELVLQVNSFVNQSYVESYNDLLEEEAALESRLGIAEKQSQPSDIPNAYPYPVDKGHSTKELNSLRKNLSDIKSRNESILAGKYQMYEILEPATSSDTITPYWKHVLLKVINPSALEK